jgi:hypothetical protein
MAYQTRGRTPVVARNSQRYESPTVSEVASLAELTLDVEKDNYPVSDGYTFQNQPINTS